MPIPLAGHRNIVRRAHITALATCAWILLLTGAPSLAFAHAALVKSAPGSREVLGRMPERIALCFNEKVELKFSSVLIGKADNAPMALDPLSQDDDPKCLGAAVPPALSPGDTALGAAINYAVHYRVLSLDGHIIEASYQFTVRPEAATP